jgi:hypothetical protein
MIFQNAKGRYINRVEMLPSVFKHAEKYCKIFDELPGSKKNVEIINADMLKYDFSDADIIYIPSNVFKIDFMVSISKKCAKLKPGTRIITLSKPMPCITQDGLNIIFNVYKKQEYLMTWGREMVIFQELL